jgi:hypothetical protein
MRNSDVIYICVIRVQLVRNSLHYKYLSEVQVFGPEAVQKLGLYIVKSGGFGCT